MDSQRFCDEVSKYVYIPMAALSQLFVAADAMTDGERREVCLRFGYFNEELRKNTEAELQLQRELAEALKSLESDVKKLERTEKRSEEDAEQQQAAADAARHIDSAIS